MRKRIFSIFLTLALLVGAVTPIMAQETEQNPAGECYADKITSVTPEFLMNFDGLTNYERNSHGFSNITSALSVIAEEEDGAHGRYFSVSGNGRITKTFDNPIKGGKYLLTFDFKRSEIGDWFYLRQDITGEGDYIDNTSNFQHSFGLAGNKAGYNSNWSIAGAQEYTAGEWANAAMYMDLDKQLMYLYINNNFCSRISISREMYGICFMVQSAATQITSLDNLALYKFSPALGEELKDMGIVYPDEFGSAIELNISSPYSGNIFTKNDEVVLSVEQKNLLEQTVEYDISYVVKNWRGDEVWRKDTKAVTLDETASTTEELHPNVKKFDIYTLNVRATPTDEKILPSAIKREFSYVNTPTYGYKNYDVGACTHPGRWTTWDDVVRAFDVAGIGYTRTDGFSVGDIAKSGDIHKAETERKTPGFFRMNTKLGIKNNLIYYLGIDDALGGKSMTVKEAAASPEALQLIETWSEKTASGYKGEIDTFELGNEINFSRIQDLSPEDYAKVSQAAYRGLKKGNPDCTVLSNGLSRGAADWVYRYLKTPGGKSCDALAIHLYQEAGTPETKKFEDYCQEVRDSMERAGCGDMPMWMTEGNTASHVSYSTEQQHAVNLVRHFPIMATKKYFDKMFFYQLQTIETNPDDIESYFGILHGPYADDANGAKAAYLAVANYIAMTENAEYESDIKNGTTYAYRYKRTDGKHVLMMYADRSQNMLSLNLGANGGTMYDMYGNPTELSSDDGRFTFLLTDEPTYFLYEGDSFEECEPVVTLDKTMMELTKNSSSSFGLTIPEGAAVSAGGNSNVSLKKEQNGNNTTISVTVNEMPEIHFDKTGYGNTADVAYIERRHDFGTQLYRDFVNAEVKKDGKTIAALALPVEYVYPEADVSMIVEPYDETNLTYWKAVIKVRNNNQDKPISGKLVMDTPENMGVDDITVPQIAAGEEKEFSFNIPPKFGHGYQLYSGRLVLDGGEEVSFALGDAPRSYGYTSRSKTAIMPINKVRGAAPVIDGVLNEDEWKSYKMTSFDKSQVSYGSQGVVTAGVVEKETFGADADYGGKDDFSGTIYAQWDEKYLYAAAMVYDDVHFQKQDPVRFYYEDHLFIELRPTTTQRHDTRIDIALSDFFDNENYTDADRKAVVYRNWSQMFDTVVGGVIPQSEDGVKAEIVRKDNVTIYEVRLPWTEIISPEVMENNKECNLTFSIRDYDGDRDKTFGWGGWFVPVNMKK